MKRIMWAWRDDILKAFAHIYPNRRCVEICSPDFFKGKEKRGEGKIVEVIITEKRKKK